MHPTATFALGKNALSRFSRKEKPLVFTASDPVPSSVSVIVVVTNPVRWFPFPLASSSNAPPIFIPGRYAQSTPSLCTNISQKFAVMIKVPFTAQVGAVPPLAVITSVVSRPVYATSSGTATLNKLPLTWGVLLTCGGR